MLDKERRMEKLCKWSIYYKIAFKTKTEQIKNLSTREEMRFQIKSRNNENRTVIWYKYWEKTGDFYKGL